MTRVVFYKTNGYYYGFEEQGHAGYASEGEDIVCSALSAMTMLVINAIEVSFESTADYTIDEETAAIRLFAPAALPEANDERKRYAISGLIKAYYCQLCELEEEYHKYLSVTEVERTVR